jgi:hypothetical protein
LYNTKRIGRENHFLDATNIMGQRGTECRNRCHASYFAHRNNNLIEGAAAFLPKVATEMGLHVVAYNLTRVMNIVGVKPLLAAIRA